MVSPYVRTVKTASGARAVQIVWSKRGGKPDLQQVGSAHTDADYEALRLKAREIIAEGQGELDLGLVVPPQGVVPITSSRMGVLWDLLALAYQRLGFEALGGQSDGDVFRRLVLARIIEPTSKLDSIRVLEEAGLDAPSYATIKRRLPTYARRDFRSQIAALNAEHVNLGPSTLVLYDSSTLYWETHQGDGFREPGFSKERRLEPQITLGLLVDGDGFPLMIEAFEGNRAETATMLPVIRSFMAAHRLADVVIVADAGMVSDTNKRQLEAEGLSFILGAKLPRIPYVVNAWRAQNPGREIPDGHVFTQPWPAAPSDRRRDQVFYYRYSHDNARRTLHGIDQQVAKAKRAIAGKAPVKRNRFITLTGGQKSLNDALEAKARGLAGLKAYVTNLVDWPPEQIIAAYHQLYQVEKSFRMSKSDLQARPVYAHQRDSIEAHLTIVFAALAIARWLETATGWSIRKIVRTLRRYRTIEIQLGTHTITAADPVPPKIAELITQIQSALN